MQTAWFPGWEVRVDGRPVPAGPGPLSGLITFQVPPGEHLVNLDYGRTAAEKAAAGISIAALIVGIGIGVASLRRRARKPLANGAPTSD
jgi:hypothetical protein